MANSSPSEPRHARLDLNRGTLTVIQLPRFHQHEQPTTAGLGLRYESESDHVIMLGAPVHTTNDNTAAHILPKFECKLLR